MTDPVRCPFCQSLNTEWLESDTLSCLDCRREVKAPAWNGANATWENDLHNNPSAYADYHHPSRLGADRSEPEWQDLFYTAREDERRRNARDWKAIVAMVRDSIGPNPHECEVLIIWALSLFLWGLDADAVGEKMKGRSWYRKNPKRAAFGRIGAALTFEAGIIGMGSANLEIAESKTVARASGFRSGVVHAKASSRNGSLGGARGLAGVDRAIDVANAVRRAGVSSADRALLEVLFADPEAKPDRRGATEWALRESGELAAPAPNLSDSDAAADSAKRDRLIADAKPAVAKRIARAQRAVEKAMRLSARHAIDDQEAALLPARRRRERDDDEVAEVGEVAPPPRAAIRPMGVPGGR